MRSSGKFIQFGKLSEERARLYLEAECGLVLVEKNFRRKVGEIDLVMRCPRTAVLVFIEVRSSARDNGYLKYSVSEDKLRKLRRVFSIYMQTDVFHKMSVKGLRFDVVWIQGEKIEHWKNIAAG